MLVEFYFKFYTVQLLFSQTTVISSWKSGPLDFVITRVHYTSRADNSVEMCLHMSKDTISHIAAQYTSRKHAHHENTPI